MDIRYNPSANIQDVSTRHLVMQMLACMWCTIFSMWMEPMLLFGVGAAIQPLLLAGLLITNLTFEAAKARPEYFRTLGRACSVEHE